MSPKKAFGILAGIFGVAVGVGVIGGLTVPPTHLSTSVVQSRAVSAEDLRAHHHRMQSAELMINRLTEKYARARNICDGTAMKLAGLSEKCNANLLRAYQHIKTIREVASDGDPVRWATLIDIIHKFEADIERPMNDLERM